MKKHRNKKKCDRKIVSAACMALACILLSGCRAGAASEKKHAIRIGVSLYRADDTFIGNIRSELEKRAKEYEQETGIKVTLDIQDAKGNSTSRISRWNALYRWAVIRSVSIRWTAQPPLGS